MTYDVGLCHSDEITNLILSHPDDLAILSISCLRTLQDVIRMTYDIALVSPGRQNVIWTLSHLDESASDRVSPGWLMAVALCHPDYLTGDGISPGWVTTNSLCHPDDMLFHLMSFGWLNWGWYLIRMSYGNFIMSTGWDTLPFLSHPDEIANFDFPQYAVAPQCFRNHGCGNYIHQHGRAESGTAPYGWCHHLKWPPRGDHQFLNHFSFDLAFNQCYGCVLVCRSKGTRVLPSDCCCSNTKPSYL